MPLKVSKRNRSQCVVSLFAVWDEKKQSNNDLSQSAVPLKLTLSGSAYSSVTNWHGSEDVAVLRELMDLHVNEHQVMYYFLRLLTV